MSLNPALGSSNSTLKITQPSAQTAHVHFVPSQEQQLAMLSRQNSEDKQRQVLVQYDVDRSEHPAGEVMFSDGYFVHFFAPKGVSPLPKHVIFVLDTSGSMWGRKVSQLQEAMLAILDSLREQDYFSLVQFSTDVTEWSPHSHDLVGLSEHTATHPASQINIEKAKLFLKAMNVSGGTNINGALRKALQLAAKQQYDTAKSVPSKNIPQPIVLFLTDGIPTIGELRNTRILAFTRAINTETKAAIFSLAFGDGANFHFLKKLSLQNHGFARRIYEAADASIQLQSFFEEIASPMLANVTFSYLGAKVKNGSVTKTHFHSYYGGGEVVVAGEVQGSADELESRITAWHGKSYQQLRSHKKQLASSSKRENLSVLERMWAYLSIKQLLDQQVAVESDKNTTQAEREKYTFLRNKALKLALKNGFVTTLTSLVVVKPANTSSSMEMTSTPISQNLETEEAIPFQNRIIALPPIPALKPSHDSKPPTSNLPSESKLTLADLTWLPEHLDPLGQLRIAPNDSSSQDSAFIVDQTHASQALDELGPSVSSVPCIAPDGRSGSCQPVSRCVLREFVDDYPMFLKYFCPIGSLAGVCCPRASST